MGAVEASVVKLALISLLGIGGAIIWIAWIKWRKEISGAIERFRAQGPVTKIAVVVFAILAIAIGGTKPGGDGEEDAPPPRMRSAPRMVAPIESDLTSLELPEDFPMVTNLCIWGIAKGEEEVELGLAWPQSTHFVDDMLDIYGNWQLLSNRWTRLMQVDVSGVQSNAIVRVDASDFPTNEMERIAFFRVASRLDSDGDGLSDAEEELVWMTNSTNADSDGDGVDDGEEINTYHTNPMLTDTDGDGLTDGEETVLDGFDPLVEDTDGDGLNDRIEWLIGTDVAECDSDADGYGDGVEVVDGRDPTSYDAGWADLVDSGVGSTGEISRPYDVSVQYIGECDDGFQVLGISPPGGTTSTTNITFNIGLGASSYHHNAFRLDATNALFKAHKTGYFSFQFTVDDWADFRVASTNVIGDFYRTGGSSGIARVPMGAGNEYPMSVVVTNVGGPVKFEFLKFGSCQATRQAQHFVRFNKPFVMCPPTGRSEVRPEDIVLLSISACGGEFGGRMTTMPTNFDHLERISIDDAIDSNLPASFEIEPDSETNIVVAYRGKLPSSRLNDVQIITRMDENETHLTSVHTAAVSVVRAELCADYDRDGRINHIDRDAWARGSILRHWINDDNDSGDVGSSDSDIPGQGWWSGDCNNGSVDGRCDLLDFASVLLDTGNIFNLLGSEASRYQFELKQGDKAVKFLWTPLRADESRACLTGTVECCGMDMNHAAHEAYVESESLALTSNNLSALRSNDGEAVFLIEGVCESRKPLVFRCFNATSGDEVAHVEMPMSISDVEKMYRLVSLRDAAEDPAFTADIPGCPYNQPACTNDVDVFFLHGFDVNAQAARAWGSEIFKRLWQSGSNARFHMLAWHGDYSWSPGDIFNGLHYQHNVWFAQRTAGALKRYIEAVQPVAANRVLMAHSLGNMVACEALREGLQVGKYFMFDAAVPSEAINGTLRAESAGDDAYTKYVRPEWRDYTNICWASNWHRLFEDAPNDARGRMSWANRFQDALTNATEVFNYYSTGDSVFTEQNDIPSLGSDVHVNWGVDWLLWIIPYPTVEVTFENHCWQKQEVLKGMATLAGTLSGGWGFNVWQKYDEVAQEWRVVCYSPAGVIAAIADGTITNRPAFDVSDADELMNPNATEDDVFLALAKHVPALSSPVGGMSVFEQDYKNIDMNDEVNGVSRLNGWGRVHNNFGVSWLHSDMKDMAYFYVYKLYEQLVQKGNLR